LICQLSFFIEKGRVCAHVRSKARYIYREDGLSSV
jgi:hypothetical protein